MQCALNDQGSDKYKVFVPLILSHSTAVKISELAPLKNILFFQITDFQTP